MKLSVIIVNYNVKYFLEQCLTSAERATQGIDAEIFVVDNNSTDGSVPYLRERFPNVKFIENRENTGFARANNQAIKSSTGEYVLLLNPDTIVGEKTFTDFIEFMDSHPDAGAAGAYMLKTDGTFALESRRGLPTPFVAFCKISGLTSLFPKSRLFGRYYMRYLDEHKATPIEIISGAYMFMRRKALDKAGLLDEDFFMYGEDIDLSYRILKSGYKNYFVPSYILHYKGESTNKSSYRYVYTFYQAMQLFFNKHYASYSFLVSIPVHLAIWSRALLAYIGNQFLYRSENSSIKMNMIVVGGKRMNDEVREILKTHQPEGRHIFIEGSNEELASGELLKGIDLGKYDSIVYDTEFFQYNTILEHLATGIENSLLIATYSTKTKRLIADGITY